jgi:hypothetical protein
MAKMKEIDIMLVVFGVAIVVVLLKVLHWWWSFID